MKYFLLFILIFVTSNSIFATQKLTLLNDPFYVPQSVSCEDLTSQLISQLKDWQYQGYLQLPMNVYFWLTDQKQWLEIDENHIPVEFLPWQFLAVSSNEIIWQAQMPIYCDNELIFTMQFKGK